MRNDVLEVIKSLEEIYEKKKKRGVVCIVCIVYIVLGHHLRKFKLSDAESAANLRFAIQCKLQTD